MPPPVLALDQGTTGSTALVVAADGRLLGRGYRERRRAVDTALFCAAHGRGKR